VNNHLSKPHTAFISYAREDTDFVHRLVFDLDRYGIAAWLDNAEIKPGARIFRDVETAISRCPFFLIALSPASLSSGWVQTEFEIAATLEIGTGKPHIIPLLVGGCKLSPFLQSRAYLDFRQSQSYFLELNKLVEILRDYPIQAKEQEHKQLGIVLFDESHGQAGWNLSERPLLHLDYSPLTEISRTLGLSIQPCGNPILLDELLSSKLLVLVSPCHARYDDREIKDIRTYVRTGGSLFALSYYFGDLHHGSNLADLLQGMGIEIQHTRVWDDSEALETPLHVRGTDQPHNLFQSRCNEVYVPLPCSLRITAQATAILKSGPESRAEVPHVIVDGVARSFRTIENGPQVLAACSKYVKGKVAVAASWQTFTASSVAKPGFNNAAFLEQILLWLAPTETLAQRQDR